MQYAEVISGAVVRIHTYLPLCYKNISNFAALDPASIRDLAWAGHHGVHFYEYVTSGVPSPMPSNAMLTGPTYSIDHEKARVVGVFELQPAEPSPPSVPANVSARQIRLWLIQRGVSMAAVDAAINALPDAAEREAVQVEWEYAPYVERTHPMLVPLAAALGLTEEQVDQAFVEASTI